jgi:hypothetical protein
VAALDGHLHAHGLKKEREGGPAQPTIIQQCPLFFKTAIMVDVRALSRAQRAEFAQLLKKIRIVTAGSATLISELDADKGFMRIPVAHLYDRVADELESSDEGDEDDEDDQGSDEGPDDRRPVAPRAARASSDSTRTAPAPALAARERPRAEIIDEGGAARGARDKRPRIGAASAPQAAADEEERKVSMPSSLPRLSKKGDVARAVVAMWEDGGTQDGQAYSALRLWTKDDRAGASSAGQITAQDCATRAKQYLFIRFPHAENTWHEDLARCTVTAQKMKVLAPRLSINDVSTSSWFDAAAAHANRRLAE